MRIPAKNKQQFQWQWYVSSITIPNGKIEHGKLVDDLERSQVYDLTGTGPLTLAYVYRSDGPRNVARQMQDFLMPGEKLWSGRVYSNPVAIHVAKLRLREEIKVR